MELFTDTQVHSLSLFRLLINKPLRELFTDTQVITDPLGYEPNTLISTSGERPAPFTKPL